MAIGNYRCFDYHQDAAHSANCRHNIAHLLGSRRCCSATDHGNKFIASLIFNRSTTTNLVVNHHRVVDHQDASTAHNALAARIGTTRLRHYSTRHHKYIVLVYHQYPHL